MSTLANFIIHPHRPFRLAIIVISTVIISCVVQYFIDQARFRAQQQQWLQQQQQLAQLQQQRQMLSVANKELNNKLSTLLSQQQQQKHKITVQQATIDQLKQQLSSSQQDIATLNKELLFYQALMQGERVNTLQVREFQLSPDNYQANSFYYRLAITQGKKVTKALTGTIELVMNSLANNKSITIPVAEHPLKLRHVQLIEGQIKLNDDSKPDSIRIIVKQGKKTTLSQSFNWRSLLKNTQ